MLNGTLDDIVLTCGYARGFGDVRLGVWGQQGRQQGGRGSLRSCGADSCCGWAVGQATSVSEVHAIYMNMYVHGGVAPGVVTQSGRGFRGVSD